jgi:hypothetical protein
MSHVEQNMMRLRKIVSAGASNNLGKRRGDSKSKESAIGKAVNYGLVSAKINPTPAPTAATQESFSKREK